MKTESNGYRILLALQGAGAEGLTNAELASAAAVDLSDMGWSTSYLIKRGYAERRVRGGRCTITASGRGVVAAGGTEPSDKGTAAAAEKKRKPAPGKKKATKKRAPAAPKTPRAETAAPVPAEFRVGIFNDFGLEIRGKKCTGALDPEEAAALAGFCATHFAAE